LHVAGDHVGARILVNNDLGDRQKLLIAAGVVAVLVRVEHILHRLIGHALDLRQDLGDVGVEFVVHYDDALIRHVGRNISAVVRNDVEIVLDLF
jgi:hypothetical protein